jgi:hypothetical protein
VVHKRDPQCKTSLRKEIANASAKQLQDMLGTNAAKPHLPEVRP